MEIAFWGTVITVVLVVPIAYLMGKNRGREEASLSLWIQGWEAHQQYSNCHGTIVPIHLYGTPEQERGSDDTG